MTRDERIHAVACAVVRALYPSIKKLRHVETEARDNPTIGRMAAAALDAADATREPGDCRRPVPTREQQIRKMEP